MLAAIGELVLEVTIVPWGSLGPDDDCDAEIRLGGGGQAANFCAWAASLGEHARLITRVGEDLAGAWLVAELEAAGVEVVAGRDAAPTGAVATLVGAGGRRSLARSRGAALGLRAEDVQARWLAGVRLLHLPGYSLYAEPLAGAARRAAELRPAAALLSVDLSSAADLGRFGGRRMAEELGRLSPDLLFAREDEAALLEEPLERLARVPVVKLGARGCLVMGRRIPAPPVSVVDGTGAGDALAAAFCTAYLDGATPLEAAGRAVLVAGAAVSRMGARP